MERLDLLLLVHEHLPDSLGQRLVPGLGQAAAQQPPRHTEQAEYGELEAGRTLPQHHDEGGDHGPHPGDGGDNPESGVADAGGEHLARDDVHHGEGPRDAELAQEGQDSGHAAGEEPDAETEDPGQAEEAGHPRPPPVTLDGVVDEEDRGELHEATEGGAGVHIRAHVARGQGEAVVTAAHNKPAPAEDETHSEEPGSEQLRHAVTHLTRLLTRGPQADL